MIDHSFSNDISRDAVDRRRIDNPVRMAASLMILGLSMVSLGFVVHSAKHSVADHAGGDTICAIPCRDLRLTISECFHVLVRTTTGALIPDPESPGNFLATPCVNDECLRDVIGFAACSEWKPGCKSASSATCPMRIDRNLEAVRQFYYKAVIPPSATRAKPFPSCIDPDSAWKNYTAHACVRYTDALLPNPNGFSVKCVMTEKCEGDLVDVRDVGRRWICIK